MRRIFVGVALLLFYALPAASEGICEGRKVSDANVFAAPICVPQTPKRVVVLDPSFGLAIGLDVGLPIVGAPLERMSDAALHKRAVDRGITSLGFVTEPSLERLVALQPDLIVAFTGSESLASGVYPMVSQLAPTLIYTKPDWRAFYALLAEFTGKTAEVTEQLAALDARVAALREKMPETKVSVLRVTSWDFQVYLDSPGGYAPFNILRDAGVTRSAYETTTDAGEVFKRPDWEELAQLDGDILLYIIGGTNDSDKNGRMEELLSNPLWQLLPAVKAGRVHRVDHGHWMQFSGLDSAHRILDDLEKFVIGGQ
ncbi:iron-siderophore ABC transporter substrate-binding protein [Rhodobacteraceae bacterium D3-12]|nr:iron-siderophore ABC transporter substrate-binding protein [Rhodobacteraceae bacterium D3-12]